MVEVDEVFDLVAPVFADYAVQLSEYRAFDHLMTEFIRYDTDDHSILVSISNG